MRLSAQTTALAALAMLAPVNAVQAAVHAQYAQYEVTQTSPKQYPGFPQRFDHSSHDLSVRQIYQGMTFSPYIYPSAYYSSGYFDNYKPTDLTIKLTNSSVLYFPTTSSDVYTTTMKYDYRFDVDEFHLFDIIADDQSIYSPATEAVEDFSISLLDLSSGLNVLDFRPGHTSTPLSAGTYLFSVYYRLTISPNDVDFPFAGGESRLTIRHVIDGSAIPEPASWCLLVIGFAALGAVVRRKQAAVRSRCKADATPA